GQAPRPRLLARGPHRGPDGGRRRPRLLHVRREGGAMRRDLLVLASLAAAAASLSCSTISHVTGADKAIDHPNQVSKVAHAISDLNKDLTPENEYYVGRSVATNILAKHQYKYVDSDAIRSDRLEGLTLYVNEVGQILAAAALSTHRSG